MKAAIRSDQGPEFIAEALKSWIGAVGAQTAYIERGSPWENGYVERSFNGRLRDELLNGEIFTTFKEAQIVIEGGANIAIACVPIPRWATSRRLRRSWNGRLDQLLRALRRPWRRVRP